MDEHSTNSTYFLKLRALKAKADKWDEFEDLIAKEMAKPDSESDLIDIAEMVLEYMGY